MSGWCQSPCDCFLFVCVEKSIILKHFHDYVAKISSATPAVLVRKHTIARPTESSGLCNNRDRGQSREEHLRVRG